MTASDGVLTTSDTFNLLVTGPAAPEPVILLSGNEVARIRRAAPSSARFPAPMPMAMPRLLLLGDIPNKVFRIVQGEIIVRADAKLDFETRPVHEINVIARDDQGATVEKLFTIKLTDVAQDPVGTKGDDKLFGDAMDNIINGRGGTVQLTGGDGARHLRVRQGFRP